MGRCLWATDYRFLNDRKEMSFGEQSIFSVAQALATDPAVPDGERALLLAYVQSYDAFRMTKVVTPFVVSFSRRGDLLSQWRAYSADGAGYSVGFAGDGLGRARLVNAAEQPGMLLVSCRYGPESLESAAKDVLLTLSKRYVTAIPDNADAASRKRVLYRFILMCCRHAAMLVPRAKHEAFAEEREYRLIAIVSHPQQRNVVRYRPTSRGLIPYLPLTLATGNGKLDIEQVYVGPTQDPESGRAAAVGFLNRLGYSGEAHVRSSQVPYRGSQ